MFIVMISMGSMPMTFVDEIGVIAMLHCLMPAARGMAMWVALGDRVRGDELIIIDQFGEYGRGAALSDQIGERPAQHKNGNGQQDDERPGRGVYVEGGCCAADRGGNADGDGTTEAGA